MLLPVSFL
uniref:Uncharacterized protein n=1 Tax=Anguilla anguilla TaxID=7936 RepID=A0A0E9UNK3_ANGAN